MQKSKHSFPLYFSFRFQAISIRTLKANVSDLTLPNKIAERFISLQCDIYMPLLFTIIIPVRYGWTQCCHCSSVKRAVSTVCFSYLVGVFLNTPSKLFTFPWRLLRKIQEYQWLRTVYVYLWSSLSIWTLDMVFWYNFEVNTKCSDIVNFAQWPHIRFSTPATGATVTWSTSVLCLLELGPSFSINNSADLSLSFRRIKRQFTLEYVCMTN